MYSHYLSFSIKEIKAKRGSPRWQVEELGSDARLKDHDTLLAMEDVLKGKIDTADHKCISTLCASNTIIRIGKSGYNTVYLPIHPYYTKSSRKSIGKHYHRMENVCSRR